MALTANSVVPSDGLKDTLTSATSTPRSVARLFCKRRLRARTTAGFVASATTATGAVAARLSVPKAWPLVPSPPLLEAPPAAPVHGGVQICQPWPSCVSSDVQLMTVDVCSCMAVGQSLAPPLN
eukprot:COSAG01_NODE_8752_length_2672_cov_5.177614_3_plen_124_part_00